MVGIPSNIPEMAAQQATGPEVFNIASDDEAPDPTKEQEKRVKSRRRVKQGMQVDTPENEDDKSNECSRHR